MALTETGLVIRRFPEIQSAIQTAILENVSSEIVFDEDTLIAQLVDIFAAEIAEREEVIQSVYDSLDRDKAEGTSLDSLLNLIGLQRIGGSFTSGNVLFTGDQGSTIPSGFFIENTGTGDRYTTSISTDITQDSCVSCTYEVASVENNTQYTITVAGLNYQYTSDADATDTEIVTGLVQAVNGFAGKTWTASILANPARVIVASDDVSNNIQLATDSLMSVSSVVVSSLVVAEEQGPIKASPNTLTTMLSSASGVTSVNNPVELGTGRDRETDAEFRLRAEESLSLSGSGTIPALTAALLNTTGVTSAIVRENVDIVTVDGRPPKSFEAIVTAPDTTEINQAIAQTIWNDKPAGIETFGNTAVNIVDSSGTQQTINFSRPTFQNIAVRVRYGLYSEEVFPANGVALIREAVLNFGQSLPADEDVIPKRFLGSIYSATEGLDNVIVECQTLTNQGDTPNVGSWSEVTIPIAPAVVASFASSDIYVETI